jgi:ABC-2 type transport system permease protein
MSMTWRMSRSIERGSLDQILTKPINPLALISISNTDVDGLSEFLLGLALILYSILNLNLAFNFVNLACFVILLICGIIVEYSFSIILTGLAFLTVKTKAVLEAFWSLESFGEYPFVIYERVLTFIFTFILPFGLAANYPATALIKGVSSVLFFELVGVTSAFLLFSIGAWNLCLRKYTSAGG